MDKVRGRLDDLRPRFHARLEDDLHQFRTGANAIRDGRAAAFAVLQQRAHRLGGAAGMFGFAEIGAAARAVDDLLVEGSRDGRAIGERLGSLIAEIERALASREPTGGL